MPPVAKTPMPASAAMIIVAATVVAPVARCGHEQRQVAPAGLGHGQALARQALDLFTREAGLQTAVDDGDGGRHSAVFTHGRFHAQRGFGVLRPGHAVADDGGLQRHHGPAVVQRSGHFGVQVEQGIHSGRSSHRRR